jgi:alpha-L-rhamnosidase
MRIPLLLVVTAILLAGAAAQGETKVSELRCEYLVNPLGIDVSAPRLSWMIESDERGAKQTAYEVQVAGSLEALEKDTPDIWTSGRVASDRSTLVEYAGPALKTDQCCFWRVRVWDQGERESTWSDAAWWTMGVLDAGDWKARWIGYDSKMVVPTDLPKKEAPAEPTQKEASPLFRKGFAVAKPVKWACVHVCGLGFHEVWLNGKKVGDHVMDAPFTRYDKRALYVTHDVTHQLQQGDNAIGVMLGHGWYDMHARCTWDFDRSPWRAAPCLKLRLHVEYEDGETAEIVTDETWKTAPGPIQFDCIRNGETYDARAERPGWDTASYDASDWQPVRMVDGPAGQLRAMMSVPARVCGTIEPSRINEPKPGVFVVDMGQNFSGWTRITASGPAGTRITLRCDERLTPEGLVDQQNKVYVYSGGFQNDTFVLKGEGEETFEPRFAYHGFQYVQIEGYPGQPTLDKIRGCVVHADFESGGEFECSNPLLNKIQKNTRWSYLSNFVGFPTDCPHREKNGWTGDAHLAAEQALLNFMPAAAYTKWLNDFKDEQKPNGEFPGIIPTSGWGYGTGPSWDSAYLLIPWYMHRYLGDTRVLADHYEGMKRYVNYLGTRAEGHIVSYGLGDWVPAKTETPPEITSTAYYAVDAQIVADAAKLLGKREDAQKYGSLARSIRDAFQKKFYKGDGIYGPGTQTALSCALYQGLAPESERVKVGNALASALDRAGRHFDGGILGAKYVMHALTDTGHADLAYTLATNKDFPSWGHWIEQGATTLWENWNGEMSRNHVMFGDISAWFYQALAGIQLDPAAPGYKHAVIRPVMVGDLKSARATHRTPYGDLHSAWEWKDEGFTLSVEAPVNTTATVYVPAPAPEQVEESDGPAANAEKVAFRRMENGCAVFDIGAGEYEFRVKH